jgi:hypothetical protein
MISEKFHFSLDKAKSGFYFQGLNFEEWVKVARIG